MRRVSSAPVMPLLDARIAERPFSSTKAIKLVILYQRLRLDVLLSVIKICEAFR
jgi:hypothetical protein